ncbi:four and a half LIM domains protein 2-like isoform X2 [Leptotrombidium deliense]|uniref:Four and a half LIM domains protein 2-like isoform X2 n=1 Tax=Leptotrombidium deliense TaxID=299467 RepID=A0A443SJK8_9ACAR|nr:four and a half LIM domains protein 2-like isoform X2 [Leptotrombidium deliense]
MIRKSKLKQTNRVHTMCDCNPKVCNNCKCPRESHDIYHEEYVDVRNRIGLKATTTTASNSGDCRDKSSQQGYSWVPPGITSDKVEVYFRKFPEEKVPKKGSKGEKYRDNQLVRQLPRQDLALAYCKFIEPEVRNKFQQFVNTRNESALDIGYVQASLETNINCKNCGESMPIGDLAVIAPKFGEFDVGWHPYCFRCSVCDEPLVDLTYCEKLEKLFCERHYAETIKPRCSACDEN